MAREETESYESFVLTRNWEYFLFWDLRMEVKVADRSGKLRTKFDRLV
ncbi:hypothetical protein [Microcoleus sp. LEGE 07076]|nr:hypothetical protein [Microcoleus sp. LEGE 07076]